MGTWDAEIFADDVACDIRDAFEEELKAQESVPAATQRVLAAFAEMISDSDDGPIIYLALASLQLEHSALQPELRRMALHIIETKQGLDRWQETTSSGAEERNRVLGELHNALSSARTTPEPDHIGSSSRNTRGASKRVQEGDIIAVPLEENMIAVGIVLHVSRYFRGGMLVGFYDQMFSSVDDVKLANLPGRFISTPNYTATVAITRGRWKVIATRPDLLKRASVPLLRVAYTLYDKDTAIRQLAPEELPSYPEFRSPGPPLVEERLRSYFNR